MEANEPQSPRWHHDPSGALDLRVRRQAPGCPARQAPPAADCSAPGQGRHDVGDWCTVATRETHSPKEGAWLTPMRSECSFDTADIGADSAAHNRTPNGTYTAEHDSVCEWVKVDLQRRETETEASTGGGAGEAWLGSVHEQPLQLLSSQTLTEALYVGCEEQPFDGHKPDEGAGSEARYTSLFAVKNGLLGSREDHNLRNEVFSQNGSILNCSEVADVNPSLSIVSSVQRDGIRNAPLVEGFGSDKLSLRRTTPGMDIQHKNTGNVTVQGQRFSAPIRTKFWNVSEVRDEPQWTPVASPVVSDLMEGEPVLRTWTQDTSEHLSGDSLKRHLHCQSTQVKCPNVCTCGAAVSVAHTTETPGGNLQNYSAAGQIGTILSVVDSDEKTVAQNTLEALTSNKAGIHGQDLATDKTQVQVSDSKYCHINNRRCLDVATDSDCDRKLPISTVSVSMPAKVGVPHTYSPVLSSYTTQTPPPHLSPPHHLSSGQCLNLDLLIRRTLTMLSSGAGTDSVIRESAPYQGEQPSGTSPAPTSAARTPTSPLKCEATATAHTAAIEPVVITPRATSFDPTGGDNSAQSSPAFNGHSPTTSSGATTPVNSMTGGESTFPEEVASGAPADVVSDGGRTSWAESAVDTPRSRRERDSSDSDCCSPTSQSPPDHPVRPIDRRPMRQWLLEQLESGEVPGLEWVDQADQVFKVPWKHGSRHGWTMEQDACLFVRWAKFTGKRGARVRLGDGGVMY